MKKSALSAFLAWLLMAAHAQAATPCRENTDCRTPGTRCVNAHNPLIAFCGPFNAKDSPERKAVVVGQDYPRSGRKPNRVATGEICKTDRDCPSTKVCTRANNDAAWRCVPR